MVRLRRLRRPGIAHPLRPWPSLGALLCQCLTAAAGPRGAYNRSAVTVEIRAGPATGALLLSGLPPLPVVVGGCCFAELL